MEGIFDFGRLLEGSILDATAGLAGITHQYGETNRYAKISIPTNDGPRIPKPAISERIQYQRHQYEPIYRGVPATTPVVGEGKPVRLLELLPADQPDIDMVCGKLHVCSLYKALAYEAISYAWGVDKAQDFPFFIATPNSSQEKVANLEAIQITPQLYAALRRIRHPSQSRFVWADQICINQMNKGEKSQQVRQMGDIYRKSTRTVVWLGEEDSDRDMIATMIESSDPDHPAI
ncbi:heterokaryon incompatibility protein-domain-containing protein [Aspergillus parasiticus]|uniref:Heterokaryon incompatibility protein-domain-containing protein n=1 Tax=Aspergillus parasiticus TaxID=5067 RepID=A0A5N6D1T6_ASPPA|nr:heterokaryon incompatibility protein-domain-containing protein [Aspergillus parasiticus]